jgi:hypothetical protein
MGHRQGKEVICSDCSFHWQFAAKLKVGSEPIAYSNR